MSASIAPLPPPTPQHSFSQVPLQASPPSTYGNSYNMSFESQHSQTAPSYSQSFSNSQSSVYPNGPVSNAGYSRSFGEGSYGGSRGYDSAKPQIYTVLLPRTRAISPTSLLTPICRRYIPASRCTKWKSKASPACVGARTGGSTLHRY